MTYQRINKLVVGKGEIIFLEGSPGDCAYLIESGSIEISVKRDGRTVSLGRRSSGEVFGEMAIIDSEPRSATAIACEASNLFIIRRDQFQKRMEKSDPVMQMALSIILDRFRETLLSLKRLQEQTSEATDFPDGVGRNEPQPYTSALEEIQLEREMSHALEKGEFIPFFQPIVNISKRTTIGFEALIRWKHPSKGIVAPGKFLPTAEACGMISRFTKSIFTQSTLFLKKLHKEVFTADCKQLPYISINISGQDLIDSELVRQLLFHVEDAEIDTQFINLEITETMLLSDPDIIIENLKNLRNAGFSVSLDDFGTGYSSLSYLHRFPVDTLKIDQSFVRDMEDNRINYEIITSIIMLAQQLKLKVIAEGIEEESQLIQLEQLGCKYGQGYLFSPPVPATEARKLFGPEEHE